MSDAVDLSDYILHIYYMLTYQLRELEWDHFKLFNRDVPFDLTKQASILAERKEARDKLHSYRGYALEQGVRLGENALEMGRVLDEIIQRCHDLGGWMKAGKTRDERWLTLSQSQHQLWIALKPLNDVLRALAIHVEAATPPRSNAPAFVPAELATAPVETPFSAGSRRPRRKRKSPSEPRPLTQRQTEAAFLVAENKGSFTEAAQQMGITRQAVQKMFKAAMKKLGKTGVKKPKTQSLPRDKRGQVNI